jgi:serine/threonine protein kinase
VYKAILGERDVVVKVYHKEVAEKYLEKYNVDIAKFEFDRNNALYQISKIREYIAKPYRVYPSSSNYVHSIIQEYVSGTILEKLIKELGYLPKEVFDAGHLIVHHAENHGLHDLDISVGNLKIDKFSGIWKPRLYDFNIMPQYMFPPNPMVGLGYKLGIRKKSFRDYRSLRNWDRRGKQKKWIGRN